MLRVFIGYDPRQPVAYSVLQFSLMRRSSRPVAITPLVIEQLPIKRMGLTPFTYSRFLVPQLCDFQGWALFLDLDMLVQADIAELFDMADQNSAVMVVKSGARFEWACVILFNCGHPDNRTLTPENVEKAEGMHGIGWTDKIGSLPAEWNHLVMYDPPKPAKLLHYTAGMPCYPETKDLGYAEEWMKELKQMTMIAPWAQLMGSSIHAKPVLERLERAKQQKPAG
jgi:lipopolysaccharide biosynthesis glycosyltransferase